MMRLQKKWEKLATERKITGCGSKVIVDDVLVYGREKRNLLEYFRAVLDVLKHHRATINLKKCKWFHERCEFVGIDVGQGGNRPAQSKTAAFEQLEQPSTWADLRMLIGVFGFYSKHLPLYELRLRPWRAILAKQQPPGETPKQEEEELMRRLWTVECEGLLQELKGDIVKEPMLARPDPTRRFYLKTDWSKEGMGA
eukprot:917909-Ditylum_brightwellii.AAC.1